VDTGHALVDEDLISLRKDPRWEKVHQYLEDCNNYFETANIKYTQVLVPKGYRKGKPIPAVVWMHGLGANPENFTNESAQVYADEINIALIGVSGTKARGPRSFVWAEDVEQDGKRLREAIEEASEKVTIEKGKVITFGFSQGAQMGLEVAVRYPEEYAGAIVLSPGARSHLNELTASPNLTKRGFVLCCGAQEHPGNVLLTSNDAAWLRRAKAQIIHKPYPGMSAHSFPPDFEDRFPEWIKFILNARGG
jgi:predicted esterase